MTAIKTALEAFKPELEARFVSFTTRGIERMIEQFGPSVKGIANSRFYKNWSENLRPFTRRAGVGSPNDPITISHERIATHAKLFADATVEAWNAKIEAKLGELDNAEIVEGGGMEFTLTGTRNGHSIRIVQDMIVNVSPKGTLFNQFPSRIYVDGKFTPAATYAKL